MSNVKKRDRQETTLEASHFLYKMRKEITDLLLFDFGYSHERAVKRVERRYGKPYDELTEDERISFNKQLKRLQAYYDWFIGNEREAVMEILRNLGGCIFSANNIMPQYYEELVQRRLYQDRAIGWCEKLKQELQYAIETLPVDIEKYIRFSDMIEHEIHLIKHWRTSDNRFKKSVIMPPREFEIQFPGDVKSIKGILQNGLKVRAAPDSASNFCYCNNNGNANNNSASNSNGVRPDFDGTAETD